MWQAAHRVVGERVLIGPSSQSNAVFNVHFAGSGVVGNVDLIDRRSIVGHHHALGALPWSHHEAGTNFETTYRELVEIAPFWTDLVVDAVAIDGAHRLAE